MLISILMEFTADNITRASESVQEFGNSSSRKAFCLTKRGEDTSGIELVGIAWHSPAFKIPKAGLPTPNLPLYIRNAPGGLGEIINNVCT